MSEQQIRRGIDLLCKCGDEEKERIFRRAVELDQDQDQEQKQEERWGQLVTDEMVQVAGRRFLSKTCRND